MPWISLELYTDLVRENEMAQSLADEVERLRQELKDERARAREDRARYDERLEKEIARNQRREDRLVDRVIVSKGAHPVVSAAEKRAEKKIPSSSVPLSALEEAKLAMYIESAAEHGYGVDVARRMFERDRRQKLEPDADLSVYNDLPIITPLEEITDDDAKEANG